MKGCKAVMTALLALCLFAACSHDGETEMPNNIIWDIAPIEFHVFIHDSEGHDLLDSTYEANVLKDVFVSYDHQDYYLDTLKDKSQKVVTRYYMPHFGGLQLRKYWDTSDYELVFGEFYGDGDGQREIVLNLPNQQQMRLSYINRFEWKTDGNPLRETKFYLDDNLLTDDYGKHGVYQFKRNEEGVYEYDR